MAHFLPWKFNDFFGKCFFFIIVWRLLENETKFQNTIYIKQNRDVLRVNLLPDIHIYIYFSFSGGKRPVNDKSLTQTKKSQKKKELGSN